MRTGIVCLESRETVLKSRASISIVACVFVLCGGLLFQATTAISQEQQPAARPGNSSGQEATPSPARPADQSPESGKSEAKPKEKKEKRGSIVAAPLPISSPAIGSGIIPVLGYIFPFSTKDKISPPSVVGAAGLITNNGSRGFAVGAQLYLKENRYRITGGYVQGNIDYNIYGTGADSDLKLPLIQTGHAYLGEILRRIWRQVFVGPRLFCRRLSYYAEAERDNRCPGPRGRRATYDLDIRWRSRDTRYQLQPFLSNGRNFF